MNNQKKIGIFVVTLSLLLAAILLLRPNSNLTNQKPDDSNQLAQASPFQLEKDGQKLGVIDPGFLLGLGAAQKSVTNLTQQLADDLAQGFIEKNPSGADSQGGWLTPDNESLLQQSVDKAAEEFQTGAQIVELHELNISSDNSTQGIANYISDYYNTLGSYGSKMKIADNLEAFSDGQNVDYITPLLSQFDGLINEMKKMTVPSDFVVFHQKEINLLFIEKSFLTALTNYFQDPLKAVAALQMMPDLEEQFAALDDSIERQLKTYGFNVVRK